MECRGFGRGGRRRLDGYRLRPRDWIAILLGIAGAGGCLLLRHAL
jgi:energy-coupling factor transporter transmembrane protein EcfT